MALGPRSQKALSTIGIGSLLLGAWYGWHLWSLKNLHAAPEEEVAVETARHEVILPEEKIGPANIQSEQAEVRPLLKEVVVPGRLAYDETQHIEVRAATAGVITKMHVQLGDKVTVGQLLVTLSSPEVGSARADEMQRSAELALAKKQADWDAARAIGIRKLVEAIQSDKSPNDIRQQITDDRLGTARETLLTAYSSKLLTQSLSERLDTVGSSGALPTKTVEERKRAFEAAAAALQATMEQTLFDANRAEQTAKLAVADAERRWQIARQKVVTLLGQSTRVANSETGDMKSEDLSIVDIVAPKEGWIEQKSLNENERVEVSTTLFIIADTRKLWLRADLRESQWSALSLLPGQEIAVHSPALDGKSLTAKVLTMGREVDPVSNAIPLVATIDNPYGQLKPGLFVRVTLPIGQTENKLAIPESAVTEHDGQAFIFIAKDKNHFVRRDVKAAPPVNGWREVLSGVQPGEQVVTSGVFALKSELLLESEE